jgi:nucleoid-associated protein YgaU/DNA-binding SARP family transcriptional activator
MNATVPLGDARRWRRYADLAGLILGLAIGAAVLNAVAGPPHLPAHFPTWNAIASTLRGSSLPLDVLAYVLTMAAWAVWFWIVASLFLRLLVTAAETATHGAAWAQTLHSISDRITLPLVRRAVDGALLATFVVNMVGRSIPSVAAAAPPISTPHVASIRSHSQPGALALDQQSGRRPRATEYTVQPGDTLWGISEQFYGTGYEFPRLVAANVGREMSDGQYFTQAGVIQPGWVLHIPQPSDRIHESNGGSYYVVEDGDTLRGIAARLLGSEDRWMELFDLNRGTAAVDGRVLSDPDLIWPGLQLRIPASAAGHGGSVGSSRAGHHRRPRRKPPVTPRPTPIRPRPTPVPPSPTLEPTTAPATSVPAPTAEATAKPAPGTSDDTAIFEVVGGSAAAAMAAGALLLARRRVRRRLSDPPIPAPPRQESIEDFADAEPGRVLAHRLHSGEAEPVVVIAGQTRQFLAEQGVEDASIILAQQDRNTATLIMRAGGGAQSRIVELAGEIGARLGGKGRAYQTDDRDVALQLSRLSLATLTLPASRDASTSFRLLPLGVLPDGSTLFANWGELGHVLVVGLPGGGSDIILTSIVGTLAARGRPDELQVWTISDPRILPARLMQLPHQRSGFIDPSDEARLQQALDYLRAQLSARMRRSDSDPLQPWVPSRDEPELALVVAELADLVDDGTTLELLSTHGPDYGLHILAASTRVDALSAETLGQFRTRLILQTLDNEESIRLLGQPDGSVLGGGEFYLRLNSRVPMRLRGFRISTDHLDHLVQLMREAYGDGSLREWTTATELPTLEPTNGDAPSLEVIPPADQPIPIDSNISSPVVEVPADETIQNHALLHVKCFGDFVVTSGDLAISPSSEEGASYKAWEILACLAAQPQGVLSREKLLTAVWPDVGPEQAASRMRTAMKRLRATLARQVPKLSRDVVRSDRDGICRLDTTLVSSDVHQFVSLLRDAAKLLPTEAKVALEEARRRYQGDLLSGHAARFYEWVDERGDSGVSLREHYREEYYRATQRLARIHFEEGRADLAALLYKDILRAEPTLEDVVRELYRCYQQLGDFSSLIREDRHLRQALREAYYDPEDPEDDPERYQPEPETIALFNEITQELETRTAANGRRANERGSTA